MVRLSASSLGPSSVGAALWLLFALLLSARCLQFWAAPPFSPDSWSYWELAQSVGREFFRIHTWRQFQFEAPYGVSFPPLWPIMIAAADNVLGLAYRSAIALNMLIATLTAAALQGFCARFARSADATGHSTLSIAAGNFGLLIACALLAHRSYCEELFAGRSMPLSLLLFVALLWQLHSAARVQPAASVSRASLSGIPTSLTRLGRTVLLATTVALATLNRFDFLPALLVLSVLVPGLLLREQKQGNQREPLRTTALTYVVWWAVLLIWLLPWAMYGLGHFGQAFVSDNSRTVLAAVATHVDEYYTAPLPNIFDATAQWVAKTAHGALAVAAALLRPMLVNLLLLTFATALALAFAARRRSALKHAARSGLWGPQRVWLYADLAMAAQLSSVLLAGFASIRYALPLELYLLVRISSLLASSAATDTRASTTSRLMPYAAGAVLLQCVLLVVPTARPWLNPARPPLDLHAYADLAKCVRSAKGARVLFLTSNNEHAYRFGALYAVDTLGTPYNYRTAQLDTLIRQFRVTHVFDELEQPLQPDLRSRLRATLKPMCDRHGLFQVQPFEVRRQAAELLSRPAEVDYRGAKSLRHSTPAAQAPALVAKQFAGASG